MVALHFWLTSSWHRAGVGVVMEPIGKYLNFIEYTWPVLEGSTSRRLIVERLSCEGWVQENPPTKVLVFPSENCYKGQAQKPLLDMLNCHATMTSIAAFASGVNVNWSCITQGGSHLFTVFSGLISGALKHTSSVVRWVHVSAAFGGKKRHRFTSQSWERPSRIRERCKSLQSS